MAVSRSASLPTSYSFLAMQATRKDLLTSHERWQLGVVSSKSPRRKRFLSIHGFHPNLHPNRDDTNDRLEQRLREQGDDEDEWLGRTGQHADGEYMKRDETFGGLLLAIRVLLLDVRPLPS